METFLEIFKSILNSIIISFLFIYIGECLFKKKISYSDKTSVFTIVLFSSYLVSAYIFIDNLLRLVTVYLALVLTYKNLFKTDISKSIVSAFLAYSCIVLGEVISVSILSIILMIFPIISLESIKNEFLINLYITLSTLFLFRKSRKYLNDILDKVSDIDSHSAYLIVSLILVVIASLLYNMTTSKVVFNFDLLISLITVVCFMSIGILIIKEKSNTNKISKKYTQLVSYSKTNEKLLEAYRISVHENKNQLIIIRNMVHPDNIELLEYIDVLFSKNQNIKFHWVNELKYLPVIGLKGFLNYKIMEMEERKISVDLFIDQKVEKSKLKYIGVKDLDSLYSIIGVFLDNALESSSESKLKIINISIYKEKTKVVFEISNSYKGKLKLDKLEEYGFSSKGQNRGVGLHLVQQLINSSPLFSNQKCLTKELFTQHLEIECKNLNKRGQKKA